VNRIEQHMESLDSRILDKQVLGPTYHERTRENLRMLLDAGWIKPGERVLEVGTGDGLMIALLAEHGIHGTGICKSRSDFEAGKQKGYDIHFSDMSDMPFEDQTFDLIYTRNAFDHSLMPAITLSEFRRVLKPYKIMFIEFEWFSTEDVRKHKEVRHVGHVYKIGGSYNKQRHWSAMSYDDMRWLAYRLDLKLIDSFFAHESQGFVIENTPYMGGGTGNLDEWGRYRHGPEGETAKARRSLLPNFLRSRS
jgi:ubiquinone/menaquinone biosynthesis C-methylase UbiE